MCQFIVTCTTIWPHVLACCRVPDFCFVIDKVSHLKTLMNVSFGICLLIRYGIRVLFNSFFLRTPSWDEFKDHVTNLKFHYADGTRVQAGNVCNRPIPS
jgi:hypothetical protein